MTQRRDTTTRFSIIGNLLADLPSGEREEESCGDAVCAGAMVKRLMIGMKDYPVSDSVMNARAV